MPDMLVVRQKSSGQFLRMSKFDPETQAPIYGPMEMAWIADSEAQAIAQASFLGAGDDHEVVRVVFARSDPSQLTNASEADAAAVLANCNARIFFKR